ncbi:MAG: hypothetical protein HYZ73_05680 [Elusimicrobia bacterium]|nr:hypothetical protein [Elusimicrobiota bacterium]
MVRNVFRLRGLIGVLGLLVLFPSPCWAANQVPIGYLDSADTTKISGWTVDPDNRSASLQVEVLVDGVVKTTVTANQPRGDLVAAGIAPNPEHGYSVSTAGLNLATGSHTVTAQAIDGQTGERQLLTGAKTLTISSSNQVPIGYLDSATPQSISGWTVDPDNRSASLQVEVLVDGVVKTTVPANQPRGDLVAAGIAPNPEHGYSVSTAGLNLAASTYTVTAQAIDGQTGERQLLTGSKTLVVPTGSLPTTPVVTDDGVWTASATTLHATWTSSDSVTGIVEYQYQITRDSSTGTVVIPWVSTSTATSVTRTGLSLSHGVRYYFGVKAKNGAGLWSAIGSSDGIVVDANAPVITGISPADGAAFTEGDLVTISVAASDLDGDSPEYQFLVDGAVARAWSSSATFTWDTVGKIKSHTVTVQVRDGLGRQAEAQRRVFGYRQPPPLPARKIE